MPKRMSFALTERQYLDGSKDVTRRLRWEHLVAGERLTAVRKGMGLKRGEKQVVLGDFEVVSVRWEPVDAITQAECDREGFPEMTPAAFVAFFCAANKCDSTTVVKRIEFRRIGAGGS